MTKPDQKQCEAEGCEKEFAPKIWYQKFCSDACRLRACRKAKRDTKREKEKP